MKKITFLFIFLLAGLVGYVSAGEISIGGVNIDGHQYGGIHSSSGRMSGPIHLEERFQVHGGQVRGSGNEALYPYSTARDQYYPQHVQEGSTLANSGQDNELVRTPVSVVLQNIFNTIGQCKVYKTPSIFSSETDMLVGTLKQGEYDSSIHNLVEDFWNGALEGGVSFRTADKEWKLARRDDGGLNLREKE